MINYRACIAKFLLLLAIISVITAQCFASAQKNVGINPRGHSDLISTVCFTPDGKMLVSGSDDGKVKLWNASTGAYIRDITNSKNAITAVAVDPAGKIVAFSDTCGLIELRYLVNNKKLRTIQSEANFPDTLDFLSGNKMLINSEVDGNVQLLSTTTGKRLKLVNGIVSNDLKVSAKSSRKGYVTLINQSTGKKQILRATYDADLFSPNGTVLATSKQETGEGNPTWVFKFWDVATGKLLSQVPYSSGALAFNYLGTKILTIDCEYLAAVHLINVQDGKSILWIDTHQYFASAGAFNKDDTKVAVGGADGGIVIWDIASNTRYDIKSSIPAKQYEP